MPGRVAGLVWACARALGSFVARRPRVVVIVGGYASFPAGVAAVLTRVPLVSVNTDAVPGAVNGALGRFAAANAVAFPGTDLPRTHVTGTPVRPELASLDRTPEGRASSRAALGLPPDRQTVASVGGSLGALRVNRAVAELAETWAACDGRALYHVTGRRDYEGFASAARGSEEAATTESGLCYRVVPFEERMPRAVCRGRRVCDPGRRHDGGRAADLGGARHPRPPAGCTPRPPDAQRRGPGRPWARPCRCPDPECDGRRLAEELDALLSDPERLRAMSEAARGHAHPDAAARVAELVDAHAR